MTSAPAEAPPRVRIRAARPEDERAVRALCARIWSDDYLPGVFAEWVRDRRGRLWVAVTGERVVGVAKLTLLGDREAWLHALRVDPEYRRRGLATALFEHRVERARRFGARVLRLDTASGNVAVRRIAGKNRFQVRERFGYFEAPAHAGTAPRRATARESAVAWRRLRQGDGLLHGAFSVRQLERADVTGAIRRGTCLAGGPPGSPTAAAIVRTERAGGHGPRVVIQSLGGTPSGVRELLRGASSYARHERAGRVGIAAASRLWPALRAARYRRPWRETMLIFERRLRGAGAGRGAR